MLSDSDAKIRIGGELFDHILAHRYLKEADAAKLFAQLVSGVNYLHQKSIVHRDLKLENLLLDKHRNIIITDFGFANRFADKKDDLMATSCGSPCYAAPELVISEGAYAGTAVDIWSCGVILYAMLSGYLPFDDDPANPDGDNINLLYRYIVATPLTFPQHLSHGARDLLLKMLVPDPEQRCDMREVMLHPWLGEHVGFLNSTCPDLEAIARRNRSHKRRVFNPLGQPVNWKQISNVQDPAPRKISDTAQTESQAMKGPLDRGSTSTKPTESSRGRHPLDVASAHLTSSPDVTQDGRQTQAVETITQDASQADRQGVYRIDQDSNPRHHDLSRVPSRQSNETSGIRPTFPVRKNRHTVQLEYEEASAVSPLNPIYEPQMPPAVTFGKDFANSDSVDQPGYPLCSATMSQAGDLTQRDICTQPSSGIVKPLGACNEFASTRVNSVSTPQNINALPQPVSCDLSSTGAGIPTSFGQDRSTSLEG